MNTEKEGFDMTYEQCLSDVIEMNEDDYIKCIRSSLKASKVFLKRRSKDSHVNLYSFKSMESKYRHTVCFRPICVCYVHRIIHK